jgi:iron(III) transport system permease protein
LQHYRFVLFEYDVTRRAIWNSLVLASATATLAMGMVFQNYGVWPHKTVFSA